ncbi:transporter substrate-binding domain-containing protein [Pseudorhodoplanes sp.]|uniref:transporter substrate-binding domain-containing protein n=1 Tax=Pseudorhodoplanes sp. TaxID=1934341 RepID=UPI002BD870D7|nr:transporter substrate-binding domain-containing protein [Pseudorhodoplanes sp.]HWV54176.1 transporter substrate-binding domain-containing protein [Pseudorhodoplanes sp.]
MHLATLTALTLVLFASAKAAVANDAAIKQLAPGEALRVAIAVGPAPSALYAVRDASGKPRGVAVDLGAALAKKIGKPVQYVEYLASGAITADADKGVWDVTFMPVDAERAKRVSFGAAYHVLTSTYLVMPTAPAKAIADTNKPAVRIAIVDGTATSRAAQATSKDATFITIKGVDEGVALLKSGKADAIALSRESLSGLAEKLPGSRILDGGFLNSYTAAAVPNGKPEALAFVSALVEEQKASGAVRKSFDEIGLRNSVVAPAGAKP